MQKLLGPSWIVRAGGLLGVIAAFLLAAPDTASGKELKSWAAAVAAASSGLVGLAARQNNVDSETAGAKKDQ